jgi:uncharacterized membrane protein YidH (DUF202 family)
MSDVGPWGVHWPAIIWPSERTFLASIPTSVGIMVFGFVVATFEIASREFLQSQNGAQSESGRSLVMGGGSMSMGMVLALAVSVRYRSTDWQAQSSWCRDKWRRFWG